MIDLNIIESEISSDLSLGLTVAKGQSVSIKNCWHFYTAGDSVDVIFHDDNEFLDGMNRILPVVACYDVLILAFVLMDTHVHFVLYGDFDSCNRFKNPVSAGLPYNSWDYPWSSGPLYFRHSNSWTSPKWMLGMDYMVQKVDDIRQLAKSRVKIKPGIRVVDGLILPSQYVAVSVVEKLFRSHKAFNFFMSISKDIDVESRGGAISHLTVPLSEMRDNRRMISQEMFGVTELRGLSMRQRVQLARRLKAQYNCSPKQIAKLCGLVYNEVIDLL